MVNCETNGDYSTVRCYWTHSRPAARWRVLSNAH